MKRMVILVGLNVSVLHFMSVQAMPSCLTLTVGAGAQTGRKQGAGQVKKGTVHS